VCRYRENVHFTCSLGTGLGSADCIAMMVVCSHTTVLLSTLLSRLFAMPELIESDVSAHHYKYFFNIKKVAEQAKQLATHDWEYGTCAEALLELYNPSLSVFNERCFTCEKLKSIEEIDAVPSLVYAKEHIRLAGDSLFGNDWAVADPASLGVSALLLSRCRSIANAEEYFEAAKRQADYLVKDALKWENGAISHRKRVAEIWADFMLVQSCFLRCRRFLSELIYCHFGLSPLRAN
jgi:hypothetical protein